MTRKDYVAIAAAIKEIRRCALDSVSIDFASERIARNLSEHCAANNPRFDRARFLKACGIQ